MFFSFVQDYKRLSIVIPKIMFVSKKQAKRDGIVRPARNRMSPDGMSGGQYSDSVFGVGGYGNSPKQQHKEVAPPVISRYEQVMNPYLDENITMNRKNPKKSVTSEVSFDSAVTPVSRGSAQRLRATTMMNNMKIIPKL